MTQIGVLAGNPRPASRTLQAALALRGPLSRRHSLTNPENTGSQRLLAGAERGERFDRALWTPSARGYDLLDDAIDFGRYVIPLVREEVAKRDRAKAA